MTYGNALIGGLIGASIDMASGAAHQFEPPEGWLAKTTKLGHGWTLDHEAQDGLPRSRLKHTANVLRREVVTTPAGQFPALLIEYTGTAMRSNRAAFNSHPTVMRLRVEAENLQPLRFESEITGSFGSQGGRPSWERTELAKIDIAEQN